MYEWEGVINGPVRLLSSSSFFLSSSLLLILLLISCLSHATSSIGPSVGDCCTASRREKKGREKWAGILSAAPSPSSSPPLLLPRSSRPFPETHVLGLFPFIEQEGTAYEGGKFRFELKFPAEYPFKPPKINFTTKVISDPELEI
eukprot:3934207-Rhodomonas_salina.1